MKKSAGRYNKSFRNGSLEVISEVSLIIRFPIPEAAFGVDFFILLGPNLKKDFICVGNAQETVLLICLWVKHIKKTNTPNDYDKLYDLLQIREIRLEACTMIL